MNYNWYQRPEWTEPCAIIDSYIASMELFRYTQDVKWLELSQKILLNGMGAGQRSNGGFGTDTCCGVTSDSLDVSSYEATWCCTMRGGEGMGKALGYLSFAAGDKSQLEIPMEIAESINRDLFTPDSLKALDEAYAAAEDLLDDEEVLEADITASSRCAV